MTPADQTGPSKQPPPKPSRIEQAMRTIEEYADELREIIKKLRRKMN
jgi:hypothetical protein